MTLNLIYIVAFGVGLKFQRKIHLNTQWPADIYSFEGTKMGNILGVEKKDDREDKGTDDTMDHRANSKFADHMKVDQEKKSESAKSKTLKQQREFLPGYACRHDLLKIVHDNR